MSAGELERHQRCDWPVRVREYRAGFAAGFALGLIVGALVVVLLFF